MPMGKGYGKDGKKANEKRRSVRSRRESEGKR